jgi:hypothetical protein
MLLSLLVVAQIAAISPTPTPRPVGSTGLPTPLVGSTDLSSVAGQKKIDRAKADAMFKQDGSSSSTPSPVHSDLAVSETVKKTVAETARAQARWHEKAVKLQDALAKAQADLQREEQRNPMAAYGVIASEHRQARPQPYLDRVARAQAALDALPEECRKAGCQPGWIR